MKRIYFSIFIVCFCSYTDAQTTLYPHNYIINNNVLSSNASPFYYPTNIISPGYLQNTTISNSDDIEFVAGNEIILKEGFVAENFNMNNGQFIARTEPIQLYVLQSPYVSLDGNNVVHVKKWEKFECAFALPYEYEHAIELFFAHYYNNTVNTATDLNPYSDDSLKVTVTFYPPAGGQIVKNCFFMRQGNWCGNGNDHDELCTYDSLGHPLGKYHWHFRFAPDDAQPGWTFKINISAPFLNSPYSSYEYSGFGFDCDSPEPDNKGYVRRNPNNTRFLKFDYNDEPFFGIGHNIGEPLHGYGDYSDANGSFDWGHLYRLDFNNVIKTLDNLHSAGANYTRLMLHKEMWDVEWHRLGVYDDFGTTPVVCASSGNFQNGPGNHQYQLWLFDSIVEHTRKDGIYFQLDACHIFPETWAEESGWGDQAYAIKFTGYTDANADVPHPERYWCNTALQPDDPDNALYWWKRRYKYIDARYGYSTNLVAYEFFNEADQALKYHDVTDTTKSLCPPRWHPWQEDTLVKDNITYWHQYMTDYITGSTASGGLDDNNHLFMSSFTSWGAWFGHDNYPKFCMPVAYPLYNHNYVNLTDVHNYDWNINTNTNADYFQYNYEMNNGDLSQGNSSWVCTGNTPPVNFRESFLPNGDSKPFHMGEIGTAGTIAVLATNWETKNYYNNYELSFHNEIWATSLMGHFTTGLSWFWDIIHRWPGSMKFPPPSTAFQILGTSFDLYDNSTPFPILLVSDEIRTFYHHYKRLSEFTSNIDFSIEWIPHKYFNDTDKLESYYMVKPNGESAYGWVRNLNHIWFNQYFFDNAPPNGNHNYSGCQVAASPATSFYITGLNPSTSYEVSFYPTIMMSNPPLPTSYTTTVDTQGNILIDLSTMPLNCDSTRADYAYAVTALPQLRVMNPNSQASQDPKTNPGTEHAKKVAQPLQFNIYPNPNSGDFNIELPLTFNDKASIVMTDITGREVLKFESVTKTLLNMQMKNFPKGIYFIRVIINNQQKIKKLILQ